MIGHVEYCLFDTVIGRCGVAWGKHGLVAVQLPEADDARTVERMLRRCPRATHAQPPPAVRDAIAAIAAMLSGAPLDLADLSLDVRDVAPFDLRVYALARSIPPGQTLTYGELAARLGDPGLARAVGQSLGRNPFAPVVPCHRVLAAGGRIGGFSAEGGAALKQRMLLAERARIGSEPSLFDAVDDAPTAGR